MGSCTALSLALRGCRITLFDRFPPPHVHGSSAGSSRIVRKAYPDALYTGIMLTGYELWRRWEKHTGTQLLNETGLMFIGDGNDPAIRAQLDALQTLQVPHRVYGSADREGPVEPFVLGSSDVGIYTSDGGWVNPQHAIRTLLDAARAAGAEVVVREVESLAALRRDYDWVVLCCGPWIRKFVDLDVRVTLQWVVYLRGVRGGPVWIIEEPSHPYGFPSTPGSEVFKLALHTQGIGWDPDHPDRPEDDWAFEAIRSLAQRRLGITTPEIAQAESCLYTNTPDEDFRFGMPEERVLFVSACSGHGFKFGPWVGEFVADVIEGKRSLEEYPRFRSLAPLRAD